ncbi:hypothetical protein BDV28DRAFT_146146 [Aspergillus coremiiformis]|uniref:F-box domain-containing protein n=1 Tax=Aspergillus coremiiformis TaxID=138285 RepID=A0A5N6ZE60_9EURO|nr:hypothetical protein BDV28DRAFT_146146 [Aspergillus coremiiformis]
MATITSLPTEILYLISSYFGGRDHDKRNTLKRLRLVSRVFHHSASSHLFRDFSMRLYPNGRVHSRALSELCRTGYSYCIRSLIIGMQYCECAATRERTEPMGDSLEMCFRRMPALRRLCCYAIRCDHCQNNGIEVVRSVVNALLCSPPHLLEALYLFRIDNATLDLFSGEGHPVMASILARLRYLKIRPEDRCRLNRGQVDSLLRYGENLRSVELMFFCQTFATSEINLHPKAPLQRLVLRGLQISSRSLSLLVETYRDTLRYIKLRGIILFGQDSHWEEPAREFRRCPLLSFFVATECHPMVDGEARYVPVNRHAHHLQITTGRRRMFMSPRECRLYFSDPFAG